MQEQQRTMTLFEPGSDGQDHLFLYVEQPMHRIDYQLVRGPEILQAPRWVYEQFVALVEQRKRWDKNVLRGFFVSLVFNFLWWVILAKQNLWTWPFPKPNDPPSFYGFLCFTFTVVLVVCGPIMIYWIAITSLSVCYLKRLGRKKENLVSQISPGKNIKASEVGIYSTSKKYLIQPID